MDKTAKQCVVCGSYRIKPDNTCRGCDTRRKVMDETKGKKLTKEELFYVVENLKTVDKNSFITSLEKDLYELTNKLLSHITALEGEHKKILEASLNAGKSYREALLKEKDGEIERLNSIERIQGGSIQYLKQKVEDVKKLVMDGVIIVEEKQTLIDQLRDTDIPFYRDMLATCQPPLDECIGDLLGNLTYRDMLALKQACTEGEKPSFHIKQSESTILMCSNPLKHNWDCNCAKKKPCPDCGGWGKVSTTEPASLLWEDCKTCHGTGEVER